MFSLRLIAVTAFAFGLSSSTVSAQLLPERLVPPQQFSIPPLPTTEQPATRRLSGADKIPAHLWSLPVGAFPGAPTALSAERLPADWKRPVIDVPLLASEADPARPIAPRQPVTGNAFLVAADPWKAHSLDRFPRFNEPLVRVTDDPSAMSAHLLITVAVPLAAPNTAPLLRLGVADPFEHLRAIRLAVPQADADAPDAARESPPRPQLAVIAPAK
ncbi:MAG: hypothetical protein ACKV2Q_31345 [Planctomycetaceae bacterium]